MLVVMYIRVDVVGEITLAVNELPAGIKRRIYMLLKKDLETCRSVTPRVE